MGKTTLTHKRTTTDKISVKGHLSDDATKLTYLVDDIEESKMVTEIFDGFAGKDVELSLSEKTEENLVDQTGNSRQ